MVGQTAEPLPLSHPNPRILIIGAGIGGLALAKLCEVAGFDYLVLEKASEFKPLGSAINLEHYVFPFLDQIGIYNELLKVGKPFWDLTVNTINLKTGKIKKNGSLPPELRRIEKYGYPGLMFARPDLMEALLEPIPKSKILMRKKVTTVQQNKDGVVVQVADGTCYHGHILVGADGCYSPVRESMYAEIEKHRPLPPNAVQLVNLLYDLKSSSYESIREMLIQYESLRKEHGRAAVNGSAVGGKLFHAKGWKGTLARYIVLNVIPHFMMESARDKVAKYRPQCGFLEFKPLGSIKRDKQEYCVRYTMEKEQANGAKKFDQEILVGMDVSTAVDGASAV